MTLENVLLDHGSPAVQRFRLAQSRGADGELRIAVPTGKDSDARRVVKELGKAPG